MHFKKKDFNVHKIELLKEIFSFAQFSKSEKECLCLIYFFFEKKKIIKKNLKMSSFANKWEKLRIWSEALTGEFSRQRPRTGR